MKGNEGTPEGRDLLNIDREVEAFARNRFAQHTAAPLSMAVFGAWESGKSFFLRCLRKRVESFASVGTREGAKSKYHGAIAQIDFNAWHYSEGNLAASFVDHILRNLRIAPDDTTEVLRARGEAIIRQLDTAKQDIAIRQKALDEAEAQMARQQHTMAELDAKIAIEFEVKKSEIARAKIELQDAKVRLEKRLPYVQTGVAPINRTRGGG
jgi:predicted KAP-like P-loop ATPase